MTRNYICILSAIFLTASALQAQVEPIAIYLKGNRFLSAEISEVEESGIHYKPVRAETTAFLKFELIDDIRWPEPKSWTETIALADARQYDEAIRRLTQITKAPRRATHYPAPGNFSTRARLKLLELYRAQMNGPAMAEQFAILKNEIELLPPKQRVLPESIPVWIAAMSENWNVVFQAAEKYPTNTDIAYLHGLGLLKKGDRKAADFQFTKAYSLEAGGNTPVARAALRKSIEVFPTSTKVHTFATVFGKGSLWEGAHETTAKLLEAPINASISVFGENNSTGSSAEFEKPTEKAKRIENMDQ